MGALSESLSEFFPHFPCCESIHFINGKKLKFVCPQIIWIQNKKKISSYWY